MRGWSLRKKGGDAGRICCARAYPARPPPFPPPKRSSAEGKALANDLELARVKAALQESERKCVELGHVVKEQEYVREGEQRRAKAAMEGMNVLIGELRHKCSGMEEMGKEKVSGIRRVWLCPEANAVPIPSRPIPPPAAPPRRKSSRTEFPR